MSLFTRTHPNDLAPAHEPEPASVDIPFGFSHGRTHIHARTWADWDQLVAGEDWQIMAKQEFAVSETWAPGYRIVAHPPRKPRAAWIPDGISEPF